ncbi:MAG: arylamine N-acetyltransferase [Actinomycetota bacterium]|nr:arylamine N-acetyltransferase [Actinomycetota bacterium]
MGFLDSYLGRLGLACPVRPDAAALGRLHAAHLERVPFENLSIALDELISLEREALIGKILERRRGGFCYELNGLFAELLSVLGYDVTLLAARVWTGESYGPPLDHLALLVGDSDRSEWLADVGFGAHSRYPLRLDFGVEQDDPDGTFCVQDVDGDVTVTKDGVIQYQLERHPRRLADFDAMCWYQQHSPLSHFGANAICSRSSANGRVSLREDILIVTTDGKKHETKLGDDPAILTAYREHFGIELDRVPRIRTL